MRFKACIANSLWLASNIPALRAFERALGCPEQTQIDLLLRNLARNRDCAYGRKHGFSKIKSYEEFAQRVPLASYEDIEPWITRICNGESNVLTADAVTHMVPTSGSSGARKLIPFTAGLQHEFDAAIGPWVCDLYRSHPAMAGGPAYWSISPALQTQQPVHSKVRIGFDDDSSYLGGMKKRLVNSAMTVPSQVRLIRDMDAFRYVTLLCLLHERELRLISVWHPSYLTLLLDTLNTEAADLIADVHSGRCKYQGALPPELIAMLNLHPLPRRSEELKSIGTNDPCAIWPRLQAISCWGDGPSATALSGLQRRFPDVFIQPKGLLATEGVMTIPFAGTYPVALRSHFFEFIDEDGNVHPVHALQPGKIYETVITTSGGLWRYRLGDFVRVTGFAERTPTLQFLGRGGKTSSLFGEKLSEIFVANVLQKIMEHSRAQISFIMLAPEQDAPGWRYTLYAEGTLPGDAAGILDAMLRENPHYAWCRDLGQLLAPRIFSIHASAYEAYLKHYAEKGARIGEIKPVTLSTESGWQDIFTGLHVHTCDKLDTLNSPFA